MMAGMFVHTHFRSLLFFKSARVKTEAPPNHPQIDRARLHNWQDHSADHLKPAPEKPDAAGIIDIKLPVRKRITMDNDRRNQEAPLVPKMVLFWLVIVAAAGILFIGGRFLAAPAAGAEGFGVPLPRSDAYAYLAAKGIRDVVSGLLLIALLAMGCQRRVLGIFILVAIYTGRRLLHRSCF
jgi:Domain of unknown function (DUF4267)